MYENARVLVSPDVGATVSGEVVRIITIERFLPNLDRRY